MLGHSGKVILILMKFEISTSTCFQVVVCDTFLLFCDFLYQIPSSVVIRVWIFFETDLHSLEKHVTLPEAGKAFIPVG